MFHFATVSRREPLADPEHTLGVEVTDASLAAQCRLGNIDPQHGCGNASYDGAALEDLGPAAACTVAAIASVYPPDGATLATSRPDVDSVAAMAVLVLRRLCSESEHSFVFELASYAERLRAVAEADCFRPALGAPRPPLPTVEQPWPPEGAVGPVDCKARFGALGVLCSPNRQQGQTEYPLSTRVAVMACWLLWGEPPGPGADMTTGWWSPEANSLLEACGLETSWEIGSAVGVDRGMRVYRACQTAADEARLDLALALRDGHMTVAVDDGIAVVRGRHVGALGVGYSQADIVVAEQTDAWDACQAPRKLTIAWREPGLVQRDELCAALNAAEQHATARAPSGPAWGGPMALLGSPEGGSVLKLERVVALVRAAMARAGEVAS